MRIPASTSDDLVKTILFGKIGLVLTCEKCGKIVREERYGEIEEND